MSQLNDQTEQQFYNAFSASSPDELKSQLERQVYNGYQAAGGGGGGGALPELTKEHKIGTYNGKDAYEIHKSITSGAINVWSETDISDLNIHEVIKYEAFMLNAGSFASLKHCVIFQSSFFCHLYNKYKIHAL